MYYKLCYRWCEMALLKKFDENGQEIGSDQVFVTEGDLLSFAKQYGGQWIDGYQAALEDIVNELFETVIFDKDHNLYNSPQVAGRRLQKFHTDKKCLLENLATAVPRIKKLLNHDL